MSPRPNSALKPASSISFVSGLSLTFAGLAESFAKRRSKFIQGAPAPLPPPPSDVLALRDHVVLRVVPHRQKCKSLILVFPTAHSRPFSRSGSVSFWAHPASGLCRPSARLICRERRQQGS